MESHVTFANNIGKYSENFFSLCVKFSWIFFSFFFFPSKISSLFTLYSFLFYISRVGRWNSMKDILLFFRLFFSNFYFSPFFSLVSLYYFLHKKNSPHQLFFFCFQFGIICSMCCLSLQAVRGKVWKCLEILFTFFLYRAQMNSLVISLRRIFCNYQFTKHMREVRWCDGSCISGREKWNRDFYKQISTFFFVFLLITDSFV